ncbi:unnamed protein product [Effrenium voratum]|nr:unnamed protein product [Effrenium voratum]
MEDADEPGPPPAGAVAQAEASEDVSISDTDEGEDDTSTLTDNFDQLMKLDSKEDSQFLVPVDKETSLETGAKDAHVVDLLESQPESHEKDNITEDEGGLSQDKENAESEEVAEDEMFDEGHKFKEDKTAEKGKAQDEGKVEKDKTVDEDKTAEKGKAQDEGKVEKDKTVDEDKTAEKAVEDGAAVKKAAKALEEGKAIGKMLETAEKALKGKTVEEDQSAVDEEKGKTLRPENEKALKDTVEGDKMLEEGKTVEGEKMSEKALEEKVQNGGKSSVNKMVNRNQNKVKANKKPAEPGEGKPSLVIDDEADLEELLGQDEVREADKARSMKLKKELASLKRKQTALKAKQSLNRGPLLSSSSSSVPVVVDDSLPYGSDGMETQAFDFMEEMAARFKDKLPEEPVEKTSDFGVLRREQFGLKATELDVDTASAKVAATPKTGAKPRRKSENVAKETDIRVTEGLGDEDKCGEVKVKRKTRRRTLDSALQEEKEMPGKPDQEDIKPHLKTFSREEDSFWAYCTKTWAQKSIKLLECNALKEAKATAAEFLTEIKARLTSADGRRWMAEAYSCIELFCGRAWVSRMMRLAGHSVASFDIELGRPQPGKQNDMDLTSDAGFLLALTTILNGKADGFLCVIGLICSSFVQISSGTHCRTPSRPLGNEQVAGVRLGNLLASRTVLLIWVLVSVDGVFLLEQPRSSMLPWHPRIRQLFRSLPKVFATSWWMGHYKSPSPKRHIGWCNADTIQRLDLGVLCRAAQRKMKDAGFQSAVTYTSRAGKKAFKGSAQLKQTQTYPRLFGLRLVRLHPAFLTRRVGPPEVSLEMAGQSLQSLFEGMDWGDLWDDADMRSVLAYVRGGHSLELGEWRWLFPHRL